MKCYITLAALASIAPGVFAMTINTPTSVVECQPQLLSWTDGQAPYYLSIIPGGQPSAAPLKTFPMTSATSMTWVVDIPGGTAVTFSLKDNTGAISYTDTVNIQKNPDGSCGGNGGAAAAPAPAPAPAAQDPPSPQAADATTGNSGGASQNSGGSTAAVAVSSGGSASTRPAAVPAAGAVTGTTRAGSTAVAPQTVARGTSSVIAAASASATRATTGATSGAGARFTVTGLGVAGLVALVGAMFL